MSQHIPDGNTQPPNTWLARKLSRNHRDPAETGGLGSCHSLNHGAPRGKEEDARRSRGLNRSGRSVERMACAQCVSPASWMCSGS